MTNKYKQLSFASRNKSVKKKRWYYSTIKGQELADLKKKRGRKKKILGNKDLREYIQAKLRIEWSLEDIAKRLKLDHPLDMTKHISRESIYHILSSSGRTKKRAYVGFTTGTENEIR